MRGVVSNGVLVWGTLILAGNAWTADWAELDQANWSSHAPDGKEADCIYGDYVLRSDRLVAVVARPGEKRDANMTVRNVGGAVIDLTRRNAPNDQLSAFYPHDQQFTFSGPVPWPSDLPTVAPSEENAARVAFRGVPRDNDSQPIEAVVGYELADGTDYLTVASRIRNLGDEPVQLQLTDGVRADGEFEFGFDKASNTWWTRDTYWQQAYGVQPVDRAWRVQPRKGKSSRDPRKIDYLTDDQEQDQDEIELEPGQAVELVRRIIPGRSDLRVRTLARSLADGAATSDHRLRVTDPAGAIAGAFVEIYAADNQDDSLGIARTDDKGQIEAQLDHGEYRATVRVPGRAETEQELAISADNASGVSEFHLPQPGYVRGQIRDGDGQPIACKVAFQGAEGTPNPNFGPDSAIRGVRNLHYTPDGRFRLAVEPGNYQLLVSHGPEYNAKFESIAVTAGQETRIDTQLERAVDTTGWLSAEYHSHSSPSGDNTSSQRGRVLNLLAEHIEFAPCTEHNRISTYVPHLEFFGAEQRMATCCGMELTGRPLPLNHQNAFPLEHRPRTQDGGGPRTDVNPIVQIERLAMWDDASDKLVQSNHPNIVQMLGDRDKDGTADSGFERMFGFMDVVEVHPPHTIFSKEKELYDTGRGRGNAMFHWLQLMNLGYRVPGVVNTDAHWNYHGSGWRRNFIRSPTDDPAEAEIDDLVDASEQGQIVMTNGPFLTVEGESESGELAGPGDDLSAPGGKVRLRIRVQCPNWLEVDRVQVFVNGRDADEYNYTRRRFANMYRTGPVVFDQQIDVSLEEDAHLVVATIGEQGRLGDVYGEDEGGVPPAAVANPIFVDIDGDGFEPNGDLLGLPLPVADDHQPSHGHDHPH